MKIAVCYIFPNANLRRYEPLARRFITSYLHHPPGETDHELYVCVNGGAAITPRQEKLFEPLVPNFIHHDNSGKDIGAYQVAAQHIACDLLVCLGTPVRCNRTCWLDRIVQAYEADGPALYGCWCFHTPTPHVRTTAFWCPPQLLNSYPQPVSNSLRYEFEHGDNSITRWCLKQGLPVLQVTWSGTYAASGWHNPKPEDCLLLDQHCE